jgi:hypothetical protein
MGCSTEGEPDEQERISGESRLTANANVTPL